MATGDTQDIVKGLKSALPRGWFSGDTPILDALLTGFATAWSGMYSIYQYVVTQARIGTATGIWLDLAALDFFGDKLPRLANELDAQYRARILAALFVEHGTRNAIHDRLLRLTGRAPVIFEPGRPADTGAYGGREPLTIIGTPAIYKTDWQGRQLQYSTARTNLLPESQSIGTSPWAVSGTGTATLNAATALDGTLTASILSDNDTTNQQYWDNVITVPAGDNATRVFSVYLKPGTAARTAIVTYALGGTSPLGGGYYTDITWSTMAVATNCGGHVVDVGGGWYRVDANLTNNGSGNTSFYSRIIPASFFSVAATGSVYAWGAQTEVVAAGQTNPSSYIPTTTAPVTVTDYAITGAGLVTFIGAPLAGATLDWTGTAYSALLGQDVTVAAATFGGGDGLTTSWQLARGYGYALGYGDSGGYGSLQMPYQALVRAYLPATAGIPLVAGYGVLPSPVAGASNGAYNTPSRTEYALLADAQDNPALNAIYQAVDAVRPTGTIVWVGTSA